jgi:hypothetical protein
VGAGGPPARSACRLVRSWSGATQRSSGHSPLPGEYAGALVLSALLMASLRAAESARAGRAPGR